jgi:hypothetical protein
MRNACLLALVLCLAGCDDEGGGSDAYDPGSLQADPAFAAAPGDEHDFATWFESEPYTDPACGLARDLHRRRELRLFYNPGDFDPIAFTRGLQRYYRRYGIEFYTRHPPIEVPLDWVLDPDSKHIEKHLRETFPDVDFDAPLPPDADTVARIYTESFRFAMAPLLDFADVYGREGEDVTNVVLLPSLLPANGSLGGDLQGATLLGLAISPRLLQSLRADGDSQDAKFWKYVPLPDSFTPMMFIDADVLTDAPVRFHLDPVVIDITMAHEFGHTLGLQHEDIPGDLMSPRIEGAADVTCSVTLDDAQIAIADASLAGDGTTMMALRAARTDAEEWTRLRDFLHGKGRAPFLPAP